MARISSYTNDTSISNTDKFLGSDGSGATRNYAVLDVTAFLRATNAAGVGGQINYIYHDSGYNSNGSRQPGTITVGNTAGQTQQAFSSVTSFKVSKFANESVKNISNLILTFSNTDIIIADTEDQNQFGIYSVATVAQDGSETSFYNIPVTYVSGSGNLNNLQSYSISVFTAGDKNFVSNQLNFSAGAAQTITHNLGKFPSVTVVDSNGKQVIGEVQHTSINALTVTFQNAFAAKVYVN